MKLILLLLSILPLAVICHAQMWLYVDDFNTHNVRNKLNDNTGCWNGNPDDHSQFCNSTFDSAVRVGNTGSSLRLDYDVDTPKTYDQLHPHTAANGYYSKLNNTDLSAFKYLVLHIKGCAQTGFTRRVNLEIKNAQQSDTYVLEGINDSWQRFIVPLWQFKKISDWTSMREMVITFNEGVTRTAGTIYIDDIYFAGRAAPEKITAKKLPKAKPITIDGVPDEWRRTSLITLDSENNLESSSGEPVKDFSARTAFRWDDEFLYFYIKVYDGQVVCRETGRDIWKEDCVELFIDPDGDGFRWNNSNDFQIGFAPASPAGVPQVWAWFQDEDPADTIDLASSIYKEDGQDVYELEAALRWQYLGITPQKGASLNISVAVNNVLYTDNGTAKLNWFYIPEEDNVLLGKLTLK